MCCSERCGVGAAHGHRNFFKKWSDVKVEVKRRITAHRRSMTATGRGTGGEELTPFDQRVAAIVGDTALTGVVAPREGDTDHPQGECINSNAMRKVASI